MRGRRAVAIAGTHGKTTTTAMVVAALRALGRDPSFVIGGDPVGGPPGRGGRDPVFVAEACEYRDSFLRLPRDVAVVLNVEVDHLDWFGDEAGVRAAFLRFLADAPSDAARLVSEDARDALGDLPARGRTTTFGFGADAGLRGVRAAPVAGGGEVIEVPADGVMIRLRHPGRHAALDGLAAYATLRALGVEAADAAAGLAEFRGVGRRMEVVADGDFVLVSDYAHHPTELAAVRDAARARWPDRRLLAVFQPHQAARTRALLDGFGAALAAFDETIVADIYAARDTDEARAAISSDHVVAAVGARGGRARRGGDLGRVAELVRELARAGDVVLLLGAGDIDGLRHDLSTSLPVP